MTRASSMRNTSKSGSGKKQTKSNRYKDTISSSDSTSDSSVLKHGKGKQKNFSNNYCLGSCIKNGCKQGFCRKIPDEATFKKTVNILNKYSDRLTCRNISKLDLSSEPLDINIIIDSFMYINQLALKNSGFTHNKKLSNTNCKNKACKNTAEQISNTGLNGIDPKKFRPCADDINEELLSNICKENSTNSLYLRDQNYLSLKKHDLVFDFNDQLQDSEDLIEDFDRSLQTDSQMSQTIKNSRVNHKFCQILNIQLDSIKIYLLTGVLNLLIDQIQHEKNYFLSLSLLRYFYTLSKYSSIDSQSYKTIREVMNDVYDLLINDDKAFTLPPHVSCRGHECLLDKKFSKFDLESLVLTIKNSIENTKCTSMRENETLVDLFEIFETLYKLNEKYNIFEPKVFILKQYFSEIDLKHEFKFLKMKFKSPFNYFFSIPLQLKAEIIKIYNSEAMKASLQDSFFRSLFEGVSEPYLFVNVRRDRVYQDTLSLLENIDEIDIKKQLKVKFIGEDGIDSGGIKKEFFSLLSHEIENDILLFNHNNSRVWLKKGVDLSKLKTIGKILGIALYNNVVLNVPFPSILFKKILGMPLQFEDLEEIEPNIYNSLKNLESCTEDDLIFIDQNFTVDIELDGKRVNCEIKPDGSNIKVCKSNFDEFKQCFFNFLTSTVIEEEFKAFSEGFYSVINYENVRELKDDELEKIIMGNEDINFDVIKNNTTYDGYSSEEQIIKDFWAFFFDMKLQKKKKLIQFITGIDRLPVGGSKSLKLVIMKNGCDTDRLPSSQTCFNTLLLPHYSSAEALRDKMGKAIEMTAGFFLM